MSLASISKYYEKIGRFVEAVKNQNIAMKNLSIIIKIQVNISILVSRHKFVTDVFAVKRKIENNIEFYILYFLWLKEKNIYNLNCRSCQNEN